MRCCNSLASKTREDGCNPIPSALFSSRAIADPNDKEAQSVLNKFLSVLENTPATYQFPLEYGDVLFIDNLRGFVHTRSPIEVNNNPDDAKRHLLRTHGRFSADVIEQMSASGNSAGLS